MRSKNRTSAWWRLAASVAATELAGAIGSIFTFQAIPSWYESLNKSPITPPNWLFAPMWITLYLLMGIALFLVWEKKGSGTGIALGFSLFSVQLILNVLWSLIFFGLHQLLFGGIEIVFLWFFIAATIIEFRGIDSRAAYLLFPYIAWVTVATLLNFSIIWVNA